MTSLGKGPSFLFCNVSIAARLSEPEAVARVDGLALTIASGSDTDVPIGKLN